MPAAEQTWITNCIPVVNRDAKTIFPRNISKNKKWEKPPMRKKYKAVAEIPLHNQWDTATTGHKILWVSLREILPTALQKPTHKLSPAASLWQTQSRTLQPPLLCLVSCFSNVPHWTVQNQPVGCSCQGGLRARPYWLQQLAQHSLPCIRFGRARGTCPKWWCSCHSEHLHLYHFWSLRKGQGVTNRAAKGTRDFLYRNSYLNPIQRGNTESIQRKATLEFLCKKLRTQGILKHLITNIHLLFISPIWINHLRNSITHRAEKGYVQEGHTSPK